MKNRLAWPLTGILLMIGSGLALTHNLPLRYDVAFGDEMTYLASGLTYTFPPDPYLAQWGSLYAAWLRFLQVFTPDTLDLFYLNWRLLIILTGTLLFLYLYLRKSGFAVSLFCALCFQFSTLNVQLDPRISAFTLCLILTGLCVIQARDWSARSVMLLTALTALVCAYVRPEFYVSMLIAFGLAVGTFLMPRFQTGQRSFRAFSGVLGLVALAVLMRLLLGNPLAPGEQGSNRSFDAFVQHFSINYNTWRNQPTDIPIVDQFKLITSIFGKDVKSMSDAFRVHPDLVIRHFWTNISNTTKAEFRVLGGLFFETPLNHLTSPYRKWILAVLFVVIVFGLIDLRETFRQLRKKPLKLTRKELALFILLLPSLASVVLVFPRTHYLYFHAVGLITMLAFLLGNIKLRVAQSPVWLAGMASLMMVWVVYQTTQQQAEKRPTPVADNIRFIRSLSLKGTVSSLEREWYRIFLYGRQQTPRWIRVDIYQPNTDFGRFLEQQNVNFILMTKDMQNYFARDSGFASFLSGAESGRFVRLKAPEPGSYLLIRPELLLKQPAVSSLTGN
ncbi:hypothetical protein GCM10028803_58800 [Larkinella knui]|uniref:Glycosyltransferase RgtA/B/C/D-like domain-containing protein n=1 Tax=Larkinella knui TaxID=2025310 RepID=A0A3P1CAA4_9BACT|nr:hypothetical protein [Larkinella knui]RRB10242.1 hypothetical protein EHT87_28805 [Larkinella knui]